MSDVKIDDNDVLKLLNLYKQENAELKLKNEALRTEIDNLKRQLADNPTNNEQVTIKQADAYEIKLSNKEMKKYWELYKEDFIKLNLNLDNAELYKEDFVKLNLNLAEMYHERGIVYFELDEYKLAIQDFDKAIKLNPNNADAYDCRGSSYFNLKQYRQAIKDYDKVIEINPNDADIYDLRGICYEKLGETAKAQADFDKAKSLGYEG